jgi:hypothetical protein
VVGAALVGLIVRVVGGDWLDGGGFFWSLSLGSVEVDALWVRGE